LVKTLIISILRCPKNQLIMLHNKDINKISELKNGFTHRWLEPDYLLRSLKCFSFSSLCKSFSGIKQSGYSFHFIFSILMSMPFVSLPTVNSIYSSPYLHCIQPRKDAFYRLKNKSSIDWRAILWVFVKKFSNLHKDVPCTGSPKCLILDDSILTKTGKAIERVSRVWDHVTQRYVLGFKLLLLSYWDGTSNIAVDFSLHREKGRNKDKPFGFKKKSLKKQFKKDREKGSAGSKRVRECDQSKIDNAIKMVRRAIAKGLQVDYLLMDSWYTCWAFVELVLNSKKQNMNLIGMYKTAKTKFEFQGKQLTHKQILNELGKAKRCRKLGLQYKQAIVTWNDVEVKLFFSRQSSKSKWKVFITTNTNLSFMKMIEIYQIRWTIEVLFKEAKQLLSLGKCQSNDFDAQIAETTITLIQHLILTLKYRYEKYESKGELFRQINKDVVEYRLNERLWGLFIQLIKVITQLFEGIDEEDIINKLINDEKAAKIIENWLIPLENNEVAA